MNRDETKKCIEIMQAYVDGKTIESRRNSAVQWNHIDGKHATPSWNFVEAEYRIKPEPKVIYVNEYTEGIKGFVFDDPKEAARGASVSAKRIAVKYIQVIE